MSLMMFIGPFSGPFVCACVFAVTDTGCLGDPDTGCLGVLAIYIICIYFSAGASKISE